MDKFTLQRLGPEGDGVRYVYTAAPEAPPGRNILRGPAVFTVGLFEELEVKSKRDYLAAADKKYRSPMKLVLGSANPVPDSLPDERALRELIESKEYRAVLGVRDTVASFDDEGRFVSLAFTAIGRVGFTPIIRSIRRFSAGRGAWGPERVDAMTGKVSIVLSMIAQVSTLVNGVQWALTTKRASPAFIEMTYTLSASREHHLSVRRSLLPTLAVFSDGERIALASCLVDGPERMARFIELDGRPSPLETVFERTILLHARH